MTEPTTYGYGDYEFDLVEGWPALPDDFDVEGKNKYGDSGISGVAIDESDDVHIVTRGSSPLVVFAKDGTFQRNGTVPLSNPHGIHWAPDGNFFVSDRDAHVVVKYGPDEKITLELGNRDQPSDTGNTTAGSVVEKAAGPFNLVTGVAVSEVGDIFVSDGYGNSRVHKFDSAGSLIKSWGVPGKGGPGEFHLPHGIGIDGEGRLLVCDRENDRIQLFDQDGIYIDMWTGLRKPTSVAFGPDGEVYVPELQHRLTILGSDGKVLSRIGGESSQTPGAFIAPHCVAIDSLGDLYVGEVTTGSRIQKFARRR